MSMLTRTPLATAAYRVRFREKDTSNQTSPAERPSERVPRVARLLALAHRIDGMIHSGELKDLAEAARLIRVTRARITQIGNLKLLAPEIQHLILSAQINSRATERTMRTIGTNPLWIHQRNGLETPEAMSHHPRARTTSQSLAPVAARPVDIVQIATPRHLR